MSSSSDTDVSSTTNSSTSSSSDDYRKRKSNKKHKRKTDKKSKKLKKHKKKQHKEKKRLKLSTATLEIAAANRVLAAVVDDDAHAFGPALPSHLKQTSAAAVIGPLLPAGLSLINSNEHAEPRTLDEDETVDDDLSFGPLPHDDNNAMTNNQIEREKRALELKIAAIEGRDIGQSSADQKSREEWMLELPDVGLRSGLASLSNMKRTFYAGKEKPDFSDRSAWTKTPQSENTALQPSTSKISVETLRSKAEAKYERERDAEQDRLAKKHKKKHKREESLMELHQKKLKKEQKEREKELAASGAKPERRPFSRDVDLKLNKIDKNQTKQIVDKAKILNTKFSSGKAKYL